VSATVSTGSVDPTSPRYFEDPYAQFAVARTMAPVQEHPNGTWMIFRHADVDHALRDTKLSSNEKYALDAPRNQMIRAATGNNDYLLRPSLSKLDRPDHTLLRRLLARPFLSTNIEKVRGRAQALQDDMLANRNDNEFDFVEEIAYPLPYKLTCELFGIPLLDDASAVRDWTFKSLHLLDPFLTEAQFHEYTAASRQFSDYLRTVVAAKRRDLSDDVLSVIIQAGDEGSVITPDQVVATIHTLFLAGFHTTVNQTSIALLALLTNAGQWAQLAAEPGLLDNAVEELLRYDATAQFMIRTVPEDYPVADAVVPAGRHVIMWLASANRDEEHWGPTANDVDITRADAKHHIAFGTGIHACLGMWLARLELQTVLGTLAQRFPGTELVDDRPHWRSTAFIRGLDRLPIRLEPS
jgi:cytochrome P450